MEGSVPSNRTKMPEKSSQEQSSYLDKRLQHQLNKHSGQTFITGNTFMKMLFFIILMAAAPIFSYYFSKDYIFEGYFEFSNDDSIIPAAFSAVFVVNLVLVVFVVSAYTEKIPEKRKVD